MFTATAGTGLRDVVGAKGQVAELGARYLRVILGGSFSIFFLLQVTTIQRALGSSKTPVAMLLLSNVLNLFLAVLFVYGPGEAPPIFSWGPLLLIGESSYCLYLLHFNVFQLIHMYHLPERLHVAALDPWVSYAALIVLSIVVYRFVENPARKTLLRLFAPASRKTA